MDMQRMFDTTVFGMSAPKIDSCLGLYLSAETAYLSSIHVSGGRPVVDHLLRVPIPQKASAGKDASPTTRTVALLNNELLSDLDRLERVLRQALEQLRPRSTQVIVSLSQQFGILRYFTIPPLDSRFWRTAVPAEAKKHIPIPFSELVYDFQIQPAAPGLDKQHKLGVLFGVIPKKNLEGLTTVLKKVGLTSLGVELAPCSVERLWDTLDGPQARPPSYAHVHLEGTEALVLLSQKGWPILFRSVQLSPEASSAERRKIDLPGSVEFAKKQLSAAAPAQIRLSGNHRDIAGWNRGLADEMEAPVRLVESAKNLGLKSEDWGAYASMGAALRYLVPTVLTVDLTLFGRISDEDRRGVYALFACVFLAIVFLVAVSLLRYGQLAVSTNEFSKLKHQLSSIPEFKNKSPSEIGDMIKSMETRVDATNSMIVPRLRLTRLLEALAEDIPDSVWINDLTYGSSMGESGSGPATGARALSITGHAMGASMVVEQDLANQFREKMEDDPRLGKLFLCSTPRTQSQPEARPGGTAAVSQEQLAKMLENRSTYSIDCSYRHK